MVHPKGEFLIQKKIINFIKRKYIYVRSGIEKYVNWYKKQNDSNFGLIWFYRKKLKNIICSEKLNTKR